MNPEINLKRLRRAQFLLSAAKFEQCPPDLGFEVAFVGRSNAGKSSVLNSVADNSHLARTSRTPGRTQLLNFFTIDESRRLVDLPGYGFAKVQASLQKAWEQEMVRYLNERRSLSGLVLVMDIRHPLLELDLNFMRWASAAGVPVRALLNKADKLSKSEAKSRLMRVEAALRKTEFAGSVVPQLFSATQSIGADALREVMVEWLAFDNSPAI